MSAPRTIPDTLDVVSIEGFGGTHRITVLAASPTAGRLIAAAPALLAALRDVLPRLCASCAAGRPRDAEGHHGVWRCTAHAEAALLATLDPPTAE